MLKYILSTIIFFIAFSLSSQTSQISYTESNDDFANPERGFYRYSFTYPDPYNHLDGDLIRERRELHRPFTALYDIYSTLVYRYFFLRGFTESPITQDYLDNMHSDFETAREAGVKIIVRFAYTQTVNSGDCNNWICPPYGDASRDRIVEHIAQLAPVLQANKDVIAVVQMGFIGTWGEGYYTDFFGDASRPPYVLGVDNWDDRNAVLGALLNAVPVERQVQIRYPQIKQKLIYGANALTTEAPLTTEEAHNGALKSRIGHHNDCFLASATDFGTYNNYGPVISGADTTNLKPYQAVDSRFVAVGGETCASFDAHDDCASAGGKADSEMRRFHYSYLNAEYNNGAVNNEWVTQGCMPDILRNLGYRLVLTEGEYSQSAKPGDEISASINIKNIGYAPPFNLRGVELILRNTEQGISYSASLNEDPRFWESGNTHTIESAVCLPANIAEGDYELLLFLPDPEITIHDRPEYAIRLANNDLWENNSGYNRLNHQITVSSTANEHACNSDIVFEPNTFVATHNINANAAAWSVYPNPTEGAFYFTHSSEDIQLESATLYNLLGQVISTKYTAQTSNVFKMNGFNHLKGTYILRLETEAGTVLKKVLVH